MSCATADKYVVFLSFRGRDTRANFISFLHRELDRRGIRAFKDDEELENGQRISPELNRAIEESRFAVVVVSVNYAESSWCLNELVKIMDLEKGGKITVMPIFYGVDPCHVRRQIGVNAEHQFKKHEDRGVSHQKILSWRLALGNLANISGDCSSDWNDDSKLVDKIADKISEKLKIFRTISDGKNIDDIDKHMKKLNRLMASYSTTGLRVVGIWARGGIARSALAKYLYQTSSEHFESHCFLENVKLISQGRHFKSHLHEEFLKNIKGECTKSLWDQKVLLVADDVDKLEQLDALAEDYSGFRRGSVVVITTQDKQLLHNHGVKIVYEIDDLRFHQEVDDTFEDFILITVYMLAFLVRDVYRKVRGKEPF